jgi:hypothetical protein
MLVVFLATNWAKIQVWWYKSVILALRRLRQEEHKFEANLNCIGRPYLKQKKSWIFKQKSCCITIVPDLLKLVVFKLNTGMCSPQDSTGMGKEEMGSQGVRCVTDQGASWESIQDIASKREGAQDDWLSNTWLKIQGRPDRQGAGKLS